MFTTKLSSLIIYLAVLIACTPVPSAIATPTSTTTVLPAVEPDPTSTVIPTPSPNIFDLNSAIQLPSSAYRQECVKTIPTNTKTIRDFSATGTAVFITNDMRLPTRIILYDLESREKHTIPEGTDPELWIQFAKVSPDRKWLFYRVGKEFTDLRNFVLSNSQGESVKTIPVDDVEGYYYGFGWGEWLGSDVLRLWSRKNTIDDILVVLLLDPFTGQVTQLRSDFDGLQSPLTNHPKTYRDDHEYLEWGIDPIDASAFNLTGANVAYSPDQDLAFYPHTDGFDVLYDIKSNRELARIVIPSWGELPKWSPTGEYISIIGSPPTSSPDSTKKDFYLLSRDGKTLKRLTYLSEQFDRVSVTQYSWSSDGTKIAFWLSTNLQLSEKHPSSSLVIVDITSGKLTDYCLSNQLVQEPVWSPDSNLLLIPAGTIHGEGADLSIDVETFLFDPSKLSVMPIMPNHLLRGWMTNDQ